ncbi:P-II family nitrogen regulator [Fictibacillus phosphorivorans]|uniref:P-II family nitrogen regulator n=1 Tax=Fictibacillus phosphorivorans TaxID=1221500 RepID=UPI00203C0BA1|nr:P-II family nitrogen regulator [Fictibacillus phosphorivorans]MCM3719501.1 P-II family nitrogen regulator [Fictibacillus phosphorivorans]MCM3777192.1 P-II family nitrogen regulator [Fictibacillus phosphorivorans]
MSNHNEIPEFELICIVVDYGVGSKVMQTAKKFGISGGTVLLGKGTIKNSLLEFFSLSSTRKEIVLMVARKTTAYKVLEQLDNKLKFTRKNHGIAFTTSVGSVIGARSCKPIDEKVEGSANENMYQAITVIVDKGNASDVIDAATEAGSKGGTIINARGSGIHETSKVFNMDIEPEKEIVMILSKRDKTDAIVSSIRTKLKIDEPGNGIIYLQDVTNTYGLYE